jgi:serine protease Do
MHAVSSRRPSLRRTLLGAAAVLALAPGAALAQNSVSPTPVAPQGQALIVAPGAIPSFADVIERVKGAVVSVRVRVGGEDEEARAGLPGLQPGDPLERFFRRFGEDGAPGARRGRPRGPQAIAQGSGFIITADGYVVTNNHVVKNAQDVQVGLDDGRSLSAKVVGVDEKTDLALLKINEQGPYPFTEWADGAPRVGDWALAVGNPFGLGGTVTAGIVSARGRDIGAGPYDDFIQIDAPVNRGNSGGPTFDVHGRVVGVNTAIYSPSGGSVGIGFAIPSAVARDVIDALREHGHVARGYIGVQIQQITPQLAESLRLKNTKGALVADAQPDAPAAKAGLRAGDVIIAVNGAPVDNPRDLSRRIAAIGPGKNVRVTFLRDGREGSADVTLAALPDQSASARAQPSDRQGDERDDRGPGRRLGLRLAPGQGGALVAEVEPASPAARQGLREGDLIVEAAGRPVTRPADVAEALREARRGERRTVLLRVRTGESTRFVALPTGPAT